jgi:hypothetical protein
MLFGIALVVAAVVTRTPAIAIGMLHATLLSALGVRFAYASNKNPRRSSGALEIGSSSVRFGGQEIARREQITAAFLSPDKSGAFNLRLVRGGSLPSVLLQVPTVDEGRAVLRVLGFDATQTVAELRCASQLFNWSVLKQLLYLLPAIMVVPLFVPAIVAFVPSAAPFLLPIIMVAMVTYVLGLTFSKTQVRIGVDGIATKWLGRERFIPFSEMERAQEFTKNVGGKTYVGVELSLRGGEKVNLPSGQKGFLVTDPAELLECIMEAKHAAGPTGELVDPALFVRGSRSMGDHVKALRALGAGSNADMRTAAIPSDKLVAVALDPNMAAPMRVGAAIAVRERLSATAREDLRRAAAKIASRPLRIALESATNEEIDDAAMAEALAEVEAAEARHTR